MAYTTSQSSTGEHPTQQEAGEEKHQMSTPQSEGSDAEKQQSELSTSKSNEIQPVANQDPELATTTTPEEEPQWVSGFKLFSIMTGISFVAFLMLLDTAIIVTAIPQITNDFHSLPDVGWYGAAYQIASAVLQPLTGKFYSSFNSKWTFMAFFALFEVGSLVTALANSSRMFIGGRAIAGMGTSGILNGAFTIIAGCVPMAKRPALIGIVTATAQLGLVIGPLLGGILTQYTTWRWCFYINLPIGGFVAALLVFIHIPDQIPKAAAISVLRTLPSKLDLLGFAIFAPAAIQLLLALQYGGITFPWNSAKIIGLFCGAGGTFALFLAWEYHRGDAAMIPFSMMRKKIVWASFVTYGLFMCQLFCTSFYLPIYFQAVKGASPTMSGVYVLPSILAHALTAVPCGILVGKVGYYLPFSLVGSALMAIAYGLLSTLSPGTSTGKWIGYQILAGVGRGLGLQIPVIAVQNTLSPSQIPVAMALVMFSQAFAGALFLSFSATIYTNSLKTEIPKYAPSVNPQAIIDAGATGFRAFLKGSELAGVLVAYSKSVDGVFYLTAGASVACVFTGWFMGFKDIRKKNTVSKAKD